MELLPTIWYRYPCLKLCVRLSDRGTVAKLTMLIHIDVPAKEFQIGVQHELVQINFDRHLPRRVDDRTHRPAGKICIGGRCVAIPGGYVLAVARHRTIIQSFN